MEHVQLGRSPVHVSRVIFGSMAIGSARSNPERRIRTIRAAIAAGITSIDTAPLYDLGTCEQAVGEAIRGVGSRVQILSKVGLRWDDPHGDLMFRAVDAQGQSVDVRRNSRPSSIRLEVERSLRNLGVETLDVVQVHIRDPLTPIEDTMGALAELLRQGKLRAIGLSTDFCPDEVLEAQRALGDIPLASLQLQYSLLHRDGEAALIPLARDRQIAVLARSPLGMGLLTGRMPPSSAFGADDLRAVTPSFHRSNLRRVAQALKTGIEPVATRHGVPFTTVALAWVLSRPGVSSVVVGASWPEQTRANAEAAELKLDAGEQLVMQQAFDRVELDPNAGVGLAQRSLVHARRIAAGLRRRLAPNPRTRESSIAS